jgi:heme oxygenase
MNLFSSLHQLPEHTEAENTPFVLRMRLKNEDEAPSKLDAIHHMQQLRHLYQAMEERLKAFPGSERLSFFGKAPWANRSELLEQDIMAMRVRLSYSERAQLEPLEKIYQPFLEAVVTIEKSSELELLAFFVVRCLGDVFGGQQLKKYNDQTFGGEPLQSNFYDSVKANMRDITAYIKDESLMSEEEIEKFMPASKAVFQFHIDLFDAMESERPVLSPSYLPSMKDCQRYTLWGVGVAVAATTAAVGMALSAN